MARYDERTYGEYWAQYYDEIYADVDEAMLDLLSSLAGTPPRALELAIGTGRIAIPLASRGVEVTGIDISEPMIEKLRARGGGEAIEVVTGDFADVAVSGSYPLVYLAFNTLFALDTQERQIECFNNVASRLDAGGRFVMDTFVPDLLRYDEHNTRMAVSSISSNQAHAYEMSIHFPVEQRVQSHHVRRLESGDTVVLPVNVRYAWPTEMDLMARLAGLELENRWGWYDRSRYDDISAQHVSVYRKAE